MIIVMEGRNQMLWKVLMERPSLDGGGRGDLCEGLTFKLIEIEG